MGPGFTWSPSYALTPGQPSPGLIYPSASPRCLRPPSGSVRSRRNSPLATQDQHRFDERARFQVSLGPASSAGSVHHTRLQRRVASSLVVGFLFAGRPFTRSGSRKRCQGFSPSQPGHRSFVRHELPRLSRMLRGCELPAPIGWGNERRGGASGARMSPRDVD
jgi:hypothetical protein